jgi:SRSO17 transposase
VVAVTSHGTDGSRHVPLGVKPFRPGSRLPKGQADPALHTKPEWAWELSEQARAAQIPFQLVVAACVSGERAQREGRRFTAGIPYIMGLRPAHGTWQWIADPPHPPAAAPAACTPAAAAQRRSASAWQRSLRGASHGKDLVRYVTEVELGTVYGPTHPVRLIAATLDPATLKPQFTGYLVTRLPLSAASAEQVDEL